MREGWVVSCRGAGEGKRVFWLPLDWRKPEEWEVRGSSMHLKCADDVVFVFKGLELLTG